MLGGQTKQPEELWFEYQAGKQTYRQLALKYGCSIRTIQRTLDKYTGTEAKAVLPSSAVVLMDTTYFGRTFGVMVFRDATTGTVLYRKYVKHETNQLYADGLKFLRGQGVEISAVVCDGRRGLLQLCRGIPVQMCQFHQVAIITRYLTRKPKLPAAIELRQLTQMLKKTDKESFTGGLQLWHTKWKAFLAERTVESTTGKSRYTHGRLRSAHRSLSCNLPWLFTWYDYPELDIPNTTNAIDGYFADLKNKLRNHNGLSLTRKQKFIDEFLKACGPRDGNG
ncbi:MAG: hypothetical protein IPH21_01140 [Flavobacteriales bacterium]|nr:hypothetical protein [Flavobacteriales bacterium]MBK9536157.1 hypothetical protein [Flavobacteriales bacterium]